MLSVLDVLGFGKCGYYAGGAFYACLHFVLNEATGEWRRK
jgi:hypothetical protein